jgi:hypothetical protein
MSVAPFAELTKQISRLADRAAKLAHKLRHLKTDDAGYFHRVGAHLSDFAAIAGSTSPPERN